jgi:hypothetical protein
LACVEVWLITNRISEFLAGLCGRVADPRPVTHRACGGGLNLRQDAQSISSQVRNLLTRSYLKDNTFLIPQTMDFLLTGQNF